MTNNISKDQLQILFIFWIMAKVGQNEFEFSFKN
jgi:hypothetical protein